MARSIKQWQMKVIGWMLAVSSLLLILVSFPSLVLSQDSQPDPYSAEAVGPVSEVATSTAELGEQVNIQSQLAQLIEQYYQDVEDYRESERKYLIARETYYKNVTLTSQSEAIKQGQELIKSRSKVLHSYFSYLQKDLENTLGIQLQDKVVMLNKLGTILSDLESADRNAGTIQSRAQLNDIFNQLNLQQGNYKRVAYSALALIKIGQLQSAIDQSLATREMVSVWLTEANLTASSRAKKEQGLAEVDGLIQNARNNLSEVIRHWQSNSQEAGYYESAYKTFQDKAEYSYLQLRQAHAFLDEIVNTL
jgi:hypothetical protein